MTEKVNNIRFLPLHIKAIFAFNRKLGITEEGVQFILERKADVYKDFWADQESAHNFVSLALIKAL